MDEITAACNLIKSQREYGVKNHILKSISIKLFEEHGYIITAQLRTSYNKSTNNPSYIHSLYYRGVVIHPTINKRRHCINEHTLNLLRKSKEMKKKVKFFTHGVGLNIRLYEQVGYSERRDKILFHSRFVGQHGLKLNVIDI
jgi:hypothetical protein